MLQITAPALQEMYAHCERDYPNEACGYLAGRDGVVTKTIPMGNAHASPSSYELDGAEQARVQREMRVAELEFLAIYHSHVATEAYPSRRDIDRATAIQEFFEGWYVLVTLKEAGRPRVRAFKIRDGYVSEENLREAAR